jgi:hypothetical protein
MKPVNVFINSAGLLLLLTASAKLISSFGHGKILDANDPFFGIQFRDLFRIVGSAEAAVALFCFFSKQSWLASGLVAWLATSFVAYRLYLIGVGYHRPCNCLGNLTDALHIPPGAADIIMKVVLGYLFLGSYASLFWLWKQNRIPVKFGVDVPRVDKVA